MSEWEIRTMGAWDVTEARIAELKRQRDALLEACKSDYEIFESMGHGEECLAPWGEICTCGLDARLKMLRTAIAQVEKQSQ